ncbi:uncharacterized protein VTP21DRAFT_3706 [Calcarisporiella thermophila]|uniref:uncharacterized protein n=1 Tax=Calcarisporiella thermophila TaxID=911321 RepID=UPI0037427E79
MSHDKENNNGVNNDAVTNGNTRSSFYTRLTSYPLVNDTVNVVHSYVTANPYGKRALDTASAAATRLSGIASPVQERFALPLAKADEFALRSLDFIEHRFPAVKQPTDELIHRVAEPPLKIYAAARETVDKNITAPAHDIVAGIDSRFGVVIDRAEQVVNQYLPPSEQEKSKTDENKEINGYKYNTTRAYNLSISTRNRIFHQIRERTPEEYRKLKDNNALVREMADRVENLAQGLATFAASLNAQVEEQRKAVRARIIAHEQELRKRVEETQLRVSQRRTALTQYTRDQLPEYVRVRLDKAAEYLSQRYSEVQQEISRKDIGLFQKTQNLTLYTFDHGVPLVQQGIQESVREVQGQVNYLQSQASNVVVQGSQWIRDRLNGAANIFGLKIVQE